jgi:hypothetical protein
MIDIFNCYSFIFPALKFGRLDILGVNDRELALGSLQTTLWLSDVWLLLSWLESQWWSSDTTNILCTSANYKKKISANAKPKCKETGTWKSEC